jgi:hypothetical protein
MLRRNEKPPDVEPERIRQVQRREVSHYAARDQS